jgi:plasmid stabilization system protein ParE
VNRVEFRPAAVADIEEAAVWYERQQSGLGEGFLAAVSDALVLITANPQLGPAIHRETHRVLLRRFPYGLYYRVLDGRILVVACMHARRDPQRWRSRG